MAIKTPDQKWKLRDPQWKQVHDFWCSLATTITKVNKEIVETNIALMETREVIDKHNPDTRTLDMFQADLDAWKPRRGKDTDER